MPTSTTIHGITYPIPQDLVKDPAQAAKLARDLQALAVSTDAALTVNRAAASAAAGAAEAGAKAYTDTTVAGVRADAQGWADAAEAAANTYTDVSFAASGPGGATDEQLDAAVDRAVLAGRIRESPFVNVHDYGAVGDGVTNDRWRIQEAINAADGRDVLLRSGAVYRIAGTLTMPASGRVSLRSDGVEPAVLYADNQSYKLIEFDTAGPPVTTTLTASVGINGRGWTVASAAGVMPGMLCEVISSELWYHDPRPGVNEARKSELHRVTRIEGSTVFMDDPANDGYNVASETVELRFFAPIQVRLENITARAVHPAPAAETNALEGIVIRHADEPVLERVNVENCARTGVAVYLSYRPRIIGGYTRGANNYYNGYGVSVNGCTHALVQDRATFESRRAVDVTGFNVISRHTRVEGCLAVGGGKNSRGDTYGWLPTGAAGAYQGAFGSHGAVDTVLYRGNTVIDVHSPFQCRGRTSIIDSNLVLGRTTGGVVWAQDGTNIFVTRNRVVAGYWSLKPQDSMIPGFRIDLMRADTLLTVYAGWQSNPPSGSRYGQIVVTGNEVEVKVALVRLFMLPKGDVTVAGNRAQVYPTIPANQAVLVDNQSGAAPVAANMASWWVGPNVLQRMDGNTGTVTAQNLPLTGAHVLEYSIAS